MNMYDSLVLVYQREADDFERSYEISIWQFIAKRKEEGKSDPEIQEEIRYKGFNGLSSPTGWRWLKKHTVKTLCEEERE